MKKITLTLLILFITFLVIPCLAQENEIKKTDEVRQAEARVDQITSDSGRFFKQGLLNLKDDRRPQAGENFNKSVEVFLSFGINLISKDNAKARECYNQLVETIYRIEFPADAQLPQILPLSAMCGWNIDNQLAVEIAKLVMSSNKVQQSIDASEIYRVKAKLDGAKTVLDTAQQLYFYLQANNVKAEGFLIAKKEFDKALLIYNDAYEVYFLQSQKVKYSDSGGFETQVFESSPLDELAKIEQETQETQKKTSKSNKANLVAGETWQTISNRTGVSVADLMAANPGMLTPRGNVFVPVKSVYNKDLIISADTNEIERNIRVVKAQSGDTVNKLAQRYGANATEIAKFNGLLPRSVLSAGREIRIPNAGSGLQKESQISRSVKPIQPNKYPIYNKPSPVFNAKLLGVKPTQIANGKVSIVMSYFNEFFHDPYSMRFVRWSKVEKGYHLGVPYWSVYVKYRAKNSFGAYVLSEMIFYIKNNKVIATKKFD